MRSEAEISRDMACKTKCCKYRITDASYSGSCEHPSCGCNANTVPMHKREQRCEHCRGTGRVTAGEQESGLTERQRVAIQFYTDNPRAAEFDFGKRFAAPGVTVPAPVVSLDECCPRCLRDGMVQRASECEAHAHAHSKSEYKRRTALGDPNVLPPDWHAEWGKPWTTLEALQYANMLLAQRGTSDSRIDAVLAGARGVVACSLCKRTGPAVNEPGHWWHCDKAGCPKLAGGVMGAPGDQGDKP